VKKYDRRNVSKRDCKCKIRLLGYYLNENPELSEPSRHRYLFVKKDAGNLLEIITANDRALKN
jgi:hypothetical protein